MSTNGIQDDGGREWEENGDRVDRPDVVGGRYRIETLLGRGGMGEVWRGRHLVTQRPVAIKLLRRALACRPEMRRRFLRESRAAAAISHPNVVEVLDAFELEDGTPAIVMPLLEGTTLAFVIAADAPLSVGATLAILLPVAAAVAATHAHGIVHRDLKPDNVFLAREAGTTVVKVLDFGVAKLATNHVDDGIPTEAGTLIGTPAYMAPEQALCEVDQDHRVDIWAIGAIAYELLSGCRPVEGANAAQIIRSLLTQAVTPLHVLVPGLPDVVNQTVMQMLRRSRNERPTLEEVLTRLRPVLATELGTKAIALGGEHLLAGLQQSRSLSERPSIEPLASYNTVKPSPGGGSTLHSPLSTTTWRGRQRAVTVVAALVVFIAIGWLLGQRRHLSSSAAAPYTSEPAASLSPTARADAVHHGVVAEAPATAPSVALAASVKVSVARPPQVRKPLRTMSVEQKPVLPNDHYPRPIDRTNPFKAQ